MKTKNIEEEIIVSDVASFLEKLKRVVEARPASIVLYRGESKKYPNPCRPNIFRSEFLSKKEMFEKSLFDTMRQCKLCHSNNYLENAIDAQHGEFPSRLLDLTYNSLIALYFAVTPFYREKIDSADTEDGVVFVFRTNKIYSPSAQNTIENYTEMIDTQESWLQNHPIFAKNHKFIDNTKINNRIIAQQGAFILFQGYGVEDIPPYLYDRIIIPGEAKKVIRKELTLYMGINTGYIYPEQYNLVNDITQKSQFIVTNRFCFNEECNNVIENLINEIEFCKSYLIAHIKDDGAIDILRYFERNINSYRIGLIELYNKMISNKEEQKIIDEMISSYNKEVASLQEFVQTRCSLKISEQLYIGGK